MTSCIRRIFGCSRAISFPIAPTPTNKTKSTAARAFDFSKKFLSRSLPVSFATVIAYPISFTYSLASLNIAALGAIFLPSFVKQLGVQCFLCLPLSITLQIACRLEWVAFLEKLIQRGVDIRSPISPDGSTLLHYAALLGLPNLAEFLIKSGLPVDALDNQGRSALHAGVVKGQSKVVEVLIDHQANGKLPYKKGDQNWSPIMIAHRLGFSEIVEKLLRFATAEEIRKILGLKDVKGFDNCQTIHDFCEVFWPASREKLPHNWKEILASLPKERSLETLLKEKTKLSSGIRLVKDLPQDMQEIGQIIQMLKRANPLFARMYELAGRPIVTIDDKLGPHGKYNSITNTILLKNGSLEELIEYLIFETANALQRASFRAIYLNRISMGREAFTMANEWLETRSCYLRIQAFVPMLGGKTSPMEARFTDDLDLNFEMFWPYLNQGNSIQIGGASSHADFYRRFSDLSMPLQVLIDRAAAYKGIL